MSSLPASEHPPSRHTGFHQRLFHSVRPGQSLRPNLTCLFDLVVLPELVPDAGEPGAGMFCYHRTVSHL